MSMVKENIMLRKCSLGIMAFNEARNIEFILRDVIKQKMQQFLLSEIIVIASGCTDNTEVIVEHYADIDNRIKLLTQASREGKASAINVFLRNAQNEFVVILNADTRIPEDSIEKVLVPLLHESVGMSGGRPIPVNNPDTFIGYCIQHLWLLHHYLALKRTKLGELIAFKNCVAAIPENTSADEATLESIFKDKGLTCEYVPEAIVYTKGPTKINEYIEQRERSFVANLWLAKTRNYYVPSLDIFFTLQIVTQHIDISLRYFIWIFGLLFLEFIARLRGLFKFIVLRKNYVTWDAISSTKECILRNV